MKVLVTGHRGFIGTVMVPMLLEEGFEVTGLDTDLYRYCTYGDEPLAVPTIAKDVRQVEPRDIEGFDAIVHLAALSNDPLGNINPDLTYDINHRASVRLAEIAKAVGVDRFLFASSCSMYGKAGEDVLDETAEFNPVTPYAKSKVYVERDVSQLADRHFSPVFLRNATAYGVSPRIRFDLVINNLVAWAYTTGKILLKSDGTPWRPLVHIEDITQAVICALRADKPVIHNLAVNVGSNSENYQMRELAQFVKETVPNCEVEYAEDAGPDPRSYKVNFDKIHSVFPDFKTRWTARMGVEQCYESYRRFGLSKDDYEGIRYKRIAHITNLIEQGKLSRDLFWQ
ncbi:NAD-dependent epimerase/dehydratase family protein [Marinobacter lutaoensis]|uniref:NAD-dependent dehydratase n=1 Tax=Marinobacter lutaoensis TaxID=135739 RepID=A0A1V2DXN7_9GAMM|nr:SDR family oxidoreductase [Marinobacter lutaoensis]NVD37072.1 SDR family oxidoreductase [Marinobacter lutaoensis]ONF45453.1 NAD-dependent dehydratase [Marinobacter lutaoensis]